MYYATCGAVASGHMAEVHICLFLAFHELHGACVKAGGCRLLCYWPRAPNMAQCRPLPLSPFERHVHPVSLWVAKFAGLHVTHKFELGQAHKVSHVIRHHTDYVTCNLHTYNTQSVLFLFRGRQ